jgi:hypothetical protein
VGCDVSTECPAIQACHNRRCVSPCNCGVGAICEVVQHTPLCFCPEGYSGNPKEACRKRNFLQYISSMALDYKSVQHAFFLFSVECVLDTDCNDDQVCHNNECINPCLVFSQCHVSAECYAEQHTAKCRCPPGLIGNPLEQCRLVECHVNSDCDDDKACIREKCYNPCLTDNPCAPTAECQVSRHTAGCYCPVGFLGDPYVECKPPPVETGPVCFYDEECPLGLACIKERCLNPCYEIQPCHPSAFCEVVDTRPWRTMICSCREGWVPLDDRSCRPTDIGTPGPQCTRGKRFI